MQKRNLVLQAAVAGAFGIVGAGAFAATIGPTTPPAYAKESIGTGTVVRVGANATANGGSATTLKFQMQGSENYAGRSTSFNLKVTLGGGATFGTAVVGQPFSTASAPLGQSATLTNTNGRTASWIATPVAGGSASTFVTINLAPSGTSASLGGAASIDFGTFGLAGTTLATGPQTVTAQVIDPVTATVLDTVTGTLGTSTSGVNVTIAPMGDNTKFIDVAQNALNFTAGANGSTSAFAAGTIKITANTSAIKAGGTAMANTDITSPTVTLGASGALSLTPFNVGLPAAGTNSAVGDETHVFIGTTAACALPGGNGVGYIATATAAPGATSVVIPNSSMAANTTYYACFIANGTTAIMPTTPTAAVNSVTIAHLATTSATLAANTTNLQPMVKNGFSTSLHFLVPNEESSATASQATPLGGYYTYVRITNTSGITGPVYVTVTDDAGTQHTSANPITTLAANASALFTSAQLETAAGMTTAPSGRIRLDINGVFPTGAALSFLVNPNGTLSNMSPNK